MCRNSALSEQRTQREKLGDVIVALGLATEDEIAQALSLQLGIPLVDLTNTPVEPPAIELIPEKVARKHLIVPISIEDRDLHIAMADPLSFEAFEEEFGAGCPHCRTSLGADFVICPGCSHSLVSSCPSCRKMVSPRWKFCPYCRHNFAEEIRNRSFA